MVLFLDIGGQSDTCDIESASWKHHLAEKLDTIYYWM